MSELQSGTLIGGRYELKKFKGSGSFGEVWLATDTSLGIDVAVKVYISLDKSGVEEFVREYKTAYGLKHPNLLAADHFDVWESRPYLVMKYCPEGSAADKVGSVTEPEAWRYIHDVASGLAYLHALEPEPIIHQDIKPDNILIDEQGNYLISDFGISKKIRSTMRRQSTRGMTAGSVSYMAPERFSENPTPVKASDVWSLGASVYELISGETPFSGMGGSLQRNGGSLPQLGEGWSGDLNMTIRACLERETWDRPLAAELAEFADAKIKGVPAKAWWLTGRTNKRQSNSNDGKMENGKTGKQKHSKAGWVVAIISWIAAAAFIIPLWIRKDEYKWDYYFKRKDYNVLADKFEDLGEKYGYVDITKVEFGNFKEGGGELTPYGGKLVSSKMRYLGAKFYCNSLAFDTMEPSAIDFHTVTFYVKIYSPNRNLYTGYSSPPGYSFSCERMITSETSSVELSSWGNNNTSSYSSGTYRYEIWANDHILYSTTFAIY